VGFNAVGVDAAVPWSRTARVDAKCLKSAPEPTHWPDLEPSSENGRVAITTIETTPLRYRLTLRSTVAHKLVSNTQLDQKDLQTIAGSNT